MDKPSATIHDAETHKIQIPTRFPTKIFLVPEIPNFFGIRGRPTNNVMAKRSRKAMKSSNIREPQIPEK
jgi:hypothetical protein